MNINWDSSPELGILNVGLRSNAACLFRASSARSLHAALSRRLELVNPNLSQALHDASEAASTSDHPWTVSPLLGTLRREDAGLVAMPGSTYHVRIAGLLPRVVSALNVAFDLEHPLGREPLMLEHVPFYVVWEETGWERVATYPSLLTEAKPITPIALEFRSPTGFRTRQRGIAPPEPRICVEGYLRRWNDFSEVTMPEEPLLGYVKAHLSLENVDIRPAAMRLGRFTEWGILGKVKWQADGSSPALLRLVNALVEYAQYCGTGMKTALGMGQTRRLRLKAR